jgi:hypothetical protein
VSSLSRAAKVKNEEKKGLTIAISPIFKLFRKRQRRVNICRINDNNEVKGAAHRNII